MQKNYSIWTSLKCKINNQNYSFFGFKEREIWVCSLGENIGFEEDGKGIRYTRLILILKVFNRRLCFVVPLTSKDKSGNFYYDLNIINKKRSVALLTQLKTIDSSRLLYRIGIIDKENFSKLKNKIKEILSF